MITLKLYNHLTESLSLEWQSLYDSLRSTSAFQSPAWAMSYSSHYQESHHLYLAFYLKGRLVGIIGIETRHRRFGIYSSLAHTISHRPCILFNPRYLEVCQSALGKSSALPLFNTLTIHNATATELEILTTLFAKKNMTELSPTIFPLRPLTLKADGTLAIKAKNQLLKRSRPILDQLKINNYYGQSLTKGLQTAFKIDEHSTKSLYHYNVFSDRNLRRFYLQLANDPILSNNLCVHLLLHKSKPIAYEIGLREGDRYTDLERAYLADYSHYTPGKVMMVMLAESLAQQGIQLFDLGPGEDNLKRTLATQNELRYTVAISRSPLVRHLLVVKDKLWSYLYSAIFAHPRLYSLYRQVKQLL